MGVIALLIAAVEWQGWFCCSHVDGCAWGSAMEFNREVTRPRSWLLVIDIGTAIGVDGIWEII